MELNSIVINQDMQNIDTVEIKDTDTEFSINDALVDDFYFTSKYVNSSNNSRTPFTAKKNLWDLKWKVNLESNLLPHQILSSHDRILVYGNTAWQLFTLKGDPISYGGLGFSEVHIDNNNQLFYFSDLNGLIQARKLSDGKELFSTFGMFDESYYRMIFHTSEDNLYVLSVEQREDPHGRARRENSVLESINYSKPYDIDSNGYLLSAKRTNTLALKTVIIHAAEFNGLWTIAIPNFILLCDRQLKVIRVIKGSFIPRAISLDQSNRMYLIVTEKDDSGKEINSLWVLDHQGKRYLNIPLSEEKVKEFNPPFIGYQKRVFIQFNNKLLTYDFKSKLLSEKIIELPFGGASVSAEDNLIIASGRMIYGVDNSENLNYLTHIEDGVWTTKPVFINNNILVCATSEFLYCFERGQKVN